MSTGNSNRIFMSILFFTILDIHPMSQRFYYFVVIRKQITVNT